MDRIEDEAQAVCFLYVPNTRVQYYERNELFGPEVTRKLSRVSGDIAHAGTCFALAQYTACVFHLMRVMEHCVQRLGRKLKISIDVRRESWAQITMHLNTKVSSLPHGAKHTVAQNRRQQKFALAVGRLDHVRIVWRNDVMHPKETYEETECLEVLNAVGAFLNGVVDDLI